LNLLTTGQRQLHEMFSLAYGAQYRQNEDVFKQLFADFEKYYKGGVINLNDAMKKVNWIIIYFRG